MFLHNRVLKTRERPSLLKKFRLSVSGLVLVLCSGISAPLQAAEATILVQLVEYEGESAYFALYLVNPDGRYEHTLWVSGDETKYFADMPRWWKYLARKPQPLDAITGASTKGGDRSVLRLNIDDSLIDAGYSLRVETSVEDQKTFPVDVEAPLSTDSVGEKIPGSGYVRHIRFKW